MDFKSLISKIESIDGPIETPKAPEQSAPVRLDEDTELRVLAGVTALTESIIAEKAVSKKQQKFMGMVHAAQKGEKPASKEVAKVAKTMKKKDAEDFASTKHKGLPEKKKAKKESIDPEAFRAEFSKIVEAKKAKKDYDGDGKVESGKDEYMGSKDKAIKKAMGKKVDEAAKPDYIDLDKDGNKKEPMKKAAKDKKADEGLDINLLKAAQKHQKENPPKKDPESERNAGKKYGYRMDGNPSEIDDTPAKKSKKVKEGSTGDYSAKKARAGKDIGKPGKAFSKIAKKAGEKYGSKERGEKVAGAVLKKLRAKEGVESTKSMVAESVEQKLSLKDMLQMVKESGGQQAIDPVDQALWTWANRVATSKIEESQKAEIFAAMIYERNGGRFEMYDVLSEDQK